MQDLTLDEVFKLVAARLPSRYEPLQLTFYSRNSRPHQDNQYIIVGDDYGTELCVSVEDGAVYSIDPEHSLPTRFVNSGIEQLAKSIEVCGAYAHRPKAECDREMWKELVAIDPKAFADAENWWAVVREQVKDGLL